MGNGAVDQRHFDELTKSQKIETLLRVAEFWWGRHDKRAQVVWKIHISLWTALAALIGIILTGRIEIERALLILVAAIFSVLVFGLHIYFIIRQAAMSRLDRAKFDGFYAEFQKQSGFYCDNGVSEKSKRATILSTSIFQYANLFGWAITFLLCGVLMTTILLGANADSAAITENGPPPITPITSADCWIDLWPVVTWESIATIALIITLVFVYRSAVATAAMADYMRKDVEFLRTPVLSIWCAKPNEFGFPTMIWNPSMAHAKVRVKATLKINNVEMKLPPNHHYGGDRIWQVQAVGPSGPPFQGHLGMEHILKSNGLEPTTFDPSTADAELKLESWSINKEAPEELLMTESSKNPDHMWRWSKVNKYWVQEIAP